jgi:hypothetical protein
MATVSLVTSTQTGACPTNASRAFVLSKEIDCTSTTTVIASADVVEAIKIPANCIVTAAALRVVTAAASATSAAGAVQVGSTALIAAADLKSAAGTVIAGAAAIPGTTAADTVDFVPTYTGAGAKGKFVLSVVVCPIG